MKILHLASHIGNIGDNASHIGFRSILSSIIQRPFEIDKLEIRKFYKSYTLQDKMSFDKKFVALANSYDLLVIGGGGFLDFWVQDSETGTTLDISNEILDQISTPLFVSSVGCIPHRKVPAGNVEKLKMFLDRLLNRKNTFLAVRNDGSSQVLKELFGETYQNRIPEVLDHAFFYTNDGTSYKPVDNPYMIINTTHDQMEMVNRRKGRINVNAYVTQMQSVMAYIIMNTPYTIVFAPHIYKDLMAADRIISKLGDAHLRSRISITPYVQGDYGCNQIFSAYKNSAMVIGMRLHSNICSIALKIPSIGIAALDRITGVYESLNMGDAAVSIDQDFGGRVMETVRTVAMNKPIVRVDENLLKTKQKKTVDLYSQALKSFGII